MVRASPLKPERFGLSQLFLLISTSSLLGPTAHGSAMELLDLTGDSDGENDVLVASPPKGTAKAGGLSSSARSFGVSARVGGRAGPAKEMLDYAVNSKCHLKGDKKRELGGGSASRSFSASFELPAGALNNTSEASRKKPKLAMLDTAPSTSAKLSRSSSSSPASTASPLSPATASYANLNPLPISSRPSQRSFVRASTSVSAPLPFPSLTLVNCKPLSGNLPGDDLRYSVEDLFGDGGATNERAIVTTMGLQLPYVTNQITGKGRTVPTLFVYHRLEQGDVKDYKKGDVVLHQAKADKGLVSMHGKLVVVCVLFCPSPSPLLILLTFRSLNAERETALATSGSARQPPT